MENTFFWSVIITVLVLASSCNSNQERDEYNSNQSSVSGNNQTYSNNSGDDTNNNGSRNLQCNLGVGRNTFNPDCGYTSNTPYCREYFPTAGSSLAVECVACLSNCDCDFNEYCSSSPTSFGVCTNFTQAGSACLPFTDQQLIDPAYDLTYKCASLFQNGSSWVIDQAGVCINQMCKMCDYRNSANTQGMQECLPDSGIKQERICIYPGLLAETHTALWNLGPLLETPSNIWWSIALIMLAIFLIVQCIGTITSLVIMKQKLSNSHSSNSSPTNTYGHNDNDQSDAQLDDYSDEDENSIELQQR